MANAVTVIIKVNRKAPPSDYLLQQMADEIENRYYVPVKLQFVGRVKVTKEHKREVTRKRVAKWRANQKHA